MRANSFLELNWLARHDKYILLPPVVFANLDYGGFFRHPCKEETLVGESYYPLDRGLIAVGIQSDPDVKDIASCLAHEWRHCWQYYQMPQDKCVEWDSKSLLSYRQKIVTFFRSSRAEYDALQFELKVAPTEWSLQWNEWLVKAGEVIG